MEISNGNTKTLTVSNELLWCKFEVQEKIIEQVINIKYLGVEVTSDRALQSEVKCKPLDFLDV
jgi:hypothetical protein